MTERIEDLAQKWIDILEKDLAHQTHRSFAPYEKRELANLLRTLKPSEFVTMKEEVA
jgi:hypothetical protein